MRARLQAKITSKGQITVPIEVRRRWNLKAGDQIDFEISDVSGGSFGPPRRRSILESAGTLPPLDLGRTLRREDIEAAIEETMQALFPSARARHAP